MALRRDGGREELVQQGLAGGLHSGLAGEGTDAIEGIVMAPPRRIGPWAEATTNGFRASTVSTCRLYATGSGHWCQGEIRLLNIWKLSSYRSFGRSSTWCTAPVVSAAKESTDHSTPVRSS
ncbi:MAG: hypothetical protein M3P85_05020 [Actinomycetota bacterium]|nr:hypothetical protein [Actinomycetota bacterium]